jgi:predicted 3-demethylubiquinone-9 3-methyltransferase (glyoxalase superfamily)
MRISSRIAPCLWFQDQAEQAARFYTSIFKNSRVGRIAHYGEAGHDIHGRLAGSVMTVAFELDGHPFVALNGGPLFKFNEAVSMQVYCDSQEEIDYFWTKLSNGGDEKAQQCGWLKDQYGLSWQILPRALPEMLGDPASQKSERTMTAMLSMKKLDLAKLQQAYDAA